MTTWWVAIGAEGAVHCGIDGHGMPIGRAEEWHSLDAAQARAMMQAVVLGDDTVVLCRLCWRLISVARGK